MSRAGEGRRVYEQVCSGCHGPEGTGHPGVYPPLAGSEWVVEDKGRLLRILLHGLTGEVMVAGEVYSGVMPGWAQVLDDEKMAALATYLRSSWGNQASAVTEADVAAIRRAGAGRSAFWTAPELMKAPRSAN